MAKRVFTAADDAKLALLEARIGKRRTTRGDSIRARNRQKRRDAWIAELLARAFDPTPMNFRHGQAPVGDQKTSSIKRT